MVVDPKQMQYTREQSECEGAVAHYLPFSITPYTTKVRSVSKREQCWQVDPGAKDQKALVQNGNSTFL